MYVFYGHFIFSLDLPTTFEKKTESEAIIEMSDSDEEEDDDSRRIRNVRILKAIFCLLEICF